MRRPLLLLAVVVSLALGASAAATPPAPAAVAVAVYEGRVEVAWTPAPDAGVQYVVYGLLGNREVPLGEHPSEARRAEAPIGYRDYGVASKAGGLHSPITWAGACIAVNPNGPQVAIRPSCDQ